jgi:hypothetical protein
MEDLHRQLEKEKMMNEQLMHEKEEIRMEAEREVGASRKLVGIFFFTFRFDLPVVPRLKIVCVCVCVCVRAHASGTLNIMFRKYIYIQ